MSLTLSELIRRTVEDIGDPLMRHIVRRCEPHGHSEDSVKAMVSVMVKRGELRMKDDDIDHDWTYRRGRNW